MGFYTKTSYNPSSYTLYECSMTHTHTLYNKVNVVQGTFNKIKGDDTTYSNFIYIYHISHITWNNDRVTDISGLKAHFWIKVVIKYLSKHDP